MVINKQVVSAAAPPQQRPGLKPIWDAYVGSFNVLPG